MLSYPINAPITFVNTNPTNELDFQSGGPASGILNKALNFVVTTRGDILYRAAGANNYLERLPIGTLDQVLTSNGSIPYWANPSSGTSTIFTSYVVSSVTGIPTSAASGATPGVWYPLNNTYVTWSTAFPGNDPDSTFNILSGLFTAPEAGYYSFDAAVTFDSGTGVNAGSGLPAAPLPSGKAVRQVQLWTSSGGGTVLSTTTRQVEGFNFNSTSINIASEGVLLALGDTVGIMVRHDRSGNNTVTIGDPLISLPSQTYFSGKKLG